MNSRQIGGSFQTRENGGGDFTARNFFYAVAHSNVTRPETNVLAVGMHRRPQKNHRVTAFSSSDILIPKNFHEITRLGLREIGKIAPKPEFVKQSRSARTVCIPATPDAFAIVLIANNQLIQSCEIELQLSAIPQFLDGFDENEVSRAGAETDIRLGRDYKKFAGFEMGCGLQFDLGKVRNGILAAARHFAHLFEDDIVQASPASDLDSHPQRKKQNYSSHRRGINGKIAIEQCRVACGSGQPPLQFQDAAFHKDEWGRQRFCHD